MSKGGPVLVGRERREWSQWQVQPTSQIAARFLLGVFAREHGIDRKVPLGSQIMGTQMERRRFAGIAIAGVLELDAILRASSSPNPRPQDGQIRTTALQRGTAFGEELYARGNNEGVIDDETRDRITAQADAKPSRTVYLAQLVREGFHPDYPGIGLVMQDATLALQLQHANNIASPLPIIPRQATGQTAPAV